MKGDTMEEQSLKRLDRKDLLGLLIQQSKRIEQLEAQLEQAEKELEDRRIILEESGSIAEASLKLNGIFTAAQDAGQQYIDSVRLRAKRQELLCEEKRRTTEARCQEMVSEAQRKSAEYWEQADGKIQALLDQVAGLQELLESRRKKT